MKNMKLQENLFKALGLFVEAMRLYVVAKLSAKTTDHWAKLYIDSLTPQQQENWKISIRNGTPPENLIDFHNLKGFALKFRDVIKEDFKKVNSLPTWFEEIAEVRHKCNHFNDLEEEEVIKAFINMSTIAKAFGMSEVEKEINLLRTGKNEQAEKPAETKKDNFSGLIPWFKNVTPHLDIRQGVLDESIFAANLSEVALGTGREIYQNPMVFFSKTYFSLGLKTVAKRVIKGLSGGEDAENRVISLQTGFGGGKTHTLISLYHIAKWGKRAVESSYTKDLIDFTGQPDFETANIAVFTNTTNDPTQGRMVDGFNIKTLWGELAYQLGGKNAYEIIRANDDNRTAPKGLFKKVLEQTKPALILIDELADYCVVAAGVTVGASSLSDQTISFMQELSEAVSSTDKCVMVSTLPASVAEVANSMEASKILNSLSNRLTRVGADTKPVADEEIFEVIRRRLFDELGDNDQIEKIISSYAHLYQGLCLGNEIPSYAGKTEYKERMRKSYPFHPELIDMFRIRWASNHDFQRTRGVLRLLASIVSDLWKRQGTLTGVNALIHTSDLNFENLDALSGQLKKLYGNGYDAVITADISGTSSNAFKIDQEKKEYGSYGLTQGLASTILLGSFGSTANKGISLDEIKLCVIKPDSFNHNSVNGALDALEGHAHYLYYSSTGTTFKRYWFHTKPNINILINQAKGEIKKEEFDAEILKRINSKINNVNTFNVLVNPSEDVPEQQKPTLIILGPQYVSHDEITGKSKTLIEKISTKKGNSERIYRNTMIFLLCSDMGIAKLQSDIQDYLACMKIKDEYQSQLEADQKEDVRKKIEEYSKQANISLVNAYSILVKYSAKTGFKTVLVKQFKDSLDIQINTNILQALKTEEWLLEAIGLSTFDRNNLLPTLGTPIKAKDVYEAFIRYDDKPMISNVDAVQRSILRYCNNGEFAIASGDGKTFNKVWYQENIPFFDINDATYWLVDKSFYKPKEETSEIIEPDNGSGTTSGSGAFTIADPGPAKTSVSTTLEPKKFKSITVSGKVDVANYNQLFTSFIMPLAQNNVEIEIRIKGRSNSSNPLSETSNQYKITKESAKQLGLNFEVEE